MFLFPRFKKYSCPGAALSFYFHCWVLQNLATDPSYQQKFVLCHVAHCVPVPSSFTTSVCQASSSANNQESRSSSCRALTLLLGETALNLHIYFMRRQEWCLLGDNGRVEAVQNWRFQSLKLAKDSRLELAWRLLIDSPSKTFFLWLASTWRRGSLLSFWPWCPQVDRRMAVFEVP